MALRTRDRLHRKLGIDRLERRDMMAAGITAALDSLGVLTINGTAGNDALVFYNISGKLMVNGLNQSFNTASVREIVVNAGAGNDTVRLDCQAYGYQAITAKATINGGDGNDLLIGGEAADSIFGGAGNDQISGGGGDDYLDGGLGNDLMYGGAGNDTLAGDKGDDTIYGQDGNDRILGGDGNDYLYGGNGDDALDGSNGLDWLFGEAGNDSLYDDQIGNQFIGGVGSNSIVYQHFGWYDMKISDDLLRSFMRWKGADGSLNRADMIAIFNQVGSDGTVSATEFGDLKGVMAVAGTFQMGDALTNLSNKVINGDRANAANLAAGSSAAALNTLVSKWFYGSDRPIATNGSTTYTYAYVSGNLFVNGAAYNDIRQGYLGDCYLLTGLGEAALRSPSVIQNMFTDNGDGTFTVRFFNNGVADYVTVDRYLPVDKSGRLVFAGVGSLATSASNELWVALAEKAYAQVNASGWLRGTVRVNSYAAVAAGYIADAFKQITGTASSLGNQINATSLINAFNAGKLIGLASVSSGAVDAGVVRSHAYMLVGYNAATQTFTLFNPWGDNNGAAPATLTMTIAQLQKNFSYFDRTI